MTETARRCTADAIADPARERPRQLHRADQGALSLPVELGFVPDRARPAPLRRGPRLDRDRDAASPTSGRTAWCRTSSSTSGTTAISPGPTSGPPAGPPPTSGITQPPVAGFALRRLWERARRPRAAPTRARGCCCPKVAAWHRWFYADARPARRGAGRDPPPLGIGPRQLDRLGRGASSACRPKASRPTPAATPSTPTRRTGRPRRSTTAISGWSSISAASAGTMPSCTTPRRSGRRPRLQRHPDPRLRRPRRPRRGARRAGDRRREPRASPRAGVAAWRASGREAHGQYLCRDRVAGALVDSASVGGLLPVFAADPAPSAPRRSPRPSTRLAGRGALRGAEPRPGRPALRRQALLARAGLAGGQLHDRRRPARRRQAEAAARIVAASLELIRESGFAEYYDPLDRRSRSAAAPSPGPRRWCSSSCGWTLSPAPRSRGCRPRGGHRGPSGAGRSGGAPAGGGRLDRRAGDHAAPFGAALQRADAQVGPRALDDRDLSGAGRGGEGDLGGDLGALRPGREPAGDPGDPRLGGSERALGERRLDAGAAPRRAAGAELGGGARLGRQADVLADAEGRGRAPRRSARRGAPASAPPAGSGSRCSRWFRYRSLR